MRSRFPRVTRHVHIGSVASPGPCYLSAVVEAARFTAEVCDLNTRVSTSRSIQLREIAIHGTTLRLVNILHSTQR